MMPDHVHFAIFTQNPEALSSFIKLYTRQFVEIHNKTCHSSGQLFDRPYGRAPKSGGKKIRTCLTYIDNNPVERKLCQRAEQYRWGFLSYYKTSYPFSERLVIRQSSWPLRKAIRTVRNRHKNGLPMTYVMLQNIFKSLSDKEKNQITDFIISTYSIINHEAAIDFYGSYDVMVAADRNNTGSEYEIKEEFVGWSDAVYSQITKVLLIKYKFDDIHDVFRLSSSQRSIIKNFLIRRYGVNPKQAAKYLHLSLD